MSTPEDRFGPIVSRWHVAEELKAELKEWMPEYLAAYDRQHGTTTPMPRSWQVRHVAAVKPEEKTPAVIVWVAGVTDRQKDPDGIVTGTLQLGVFLVAGARDITTTGDVLHRYAAAVDALLVDRHTIRGNCTSLELIDEDYTRVDEARERMFVSVDLSYNAYGVTLAVRGGAPAGEDPRDDPEPPWPPAPLAEQVFVTVHPRPIDPEDP